MWFEIIKVYTGVILSMNQRAEGQANLATASRIDKDSIQPYVVRPASESLTLRLLRAARRVAAPENFASHAEPFFLLQSVFPPRNALYDC